MSSGYSSIPTNYNATIFNKIQFRDRNNPLDFDIRADRIMKNIEIINKRIQDLTVKEISNTDTANLINAREKEEKFYS
jgi:hypothetical protein